jgi:hypothetical protein
MKRLIIPLTGLLLLLSGCIATDNPIPPEKISQLNGLWQQDDGRASIHFYADETIKLSMPDEQPPIRLLSQLEIIKDEQIGFGVGDRWNGPVHVEIGKDGQSLQLIFPAEPVRTLHFHRAR